MSNNKIDVVLDKIYEENPSFWPYGLSKDHFDGGLYLVKENSSDATVGFVGWQQRKKGSKTVGYYSVGILPEHRRKGYAKEAVSKLIKEKRASVDEVRALIKEQNTPSQALAQRLEDVNIIKVAYADSNEGLNKYINPAIDFFTSPFVNSGSRFQQGSESFEKGNLLQGAKQMLHSGLNAGEGAVNLALGAGVGAMGVRGLGLFGRGALRSLRGPKAMQQVFRNIPRGVGSTFGTGMKYMDTATYLKQLPWLRRFGRPLLANYGLARRKALLGVNRYAPEALRRPARIATKGLFGIGNMAPEMAVIGGSMAMDEAAQEIPQDRYAPTILSQADIFGRTFF